ncbi:hypothetical protein DFP72DRAFT_1082035 [Ephemerocybe angulata]|uniref:Uncharacterized protein n=1 Tax=Ephemerocybe angulata TaxID=980116 RepID=A0A8H6H9G5_9AGAR|nr:hypothetical protein DFP72DRAFT_1082035 [Tulosesus angulatus]
MADGFVHLDLKDKFKDIQRTASMGVRTAYYYTTSITDTRMTPITLVALKDIIFRAAH